MYLNYYNMAKAPFHITPDPEFLYLSPSHKEALGAIIYCISKKKGFVSVIGEVGTGKTTIIRSYLARSNRNVVKPIYVFNPSVRFSELLKTIFQELGVEPCNENVYDMVQQLHTVLIGEYEQKHNIVLIIDEAQNMPIATFERLRILSNLETPKDKLLQIILVGQPELAEKLAGKELRQLNQRLAIRATLWPLSPRESRDYILFRLSKVTPSPHGIFSNGALKRIIRAAQGSPRMLNILCDNALVAGYGYQEQRITGAIAKQVIADFEGRGRRPRFFFLKYAPLFGLFILGVTFLGGLHAFLPLARFSFGQNEQIPANGPAELESATLQTKPQSGPAPDLSQNEAAAPPPPLEDGGQVMPAGSTDSEVVISAESNDPEAVISAGDTGPEVPVATDSTGQDRASMILVSRDEKKPADKPSMSNLPEVKRVDIVSFSPPPEKIKDGATVRTIKQGEYLSRICLDIYGFVDSRTIQAIKEKNPQILDPDLIFTGDTIIFPFPLTSEGRRSDYQGGQ
jgi:general secretion pathway protein A